MKLYFRSLTGSSGLTDNDVVAALWFLSLLRRFSERDGCYVVPATCSKCDKVYGEEFEAARATVAARGRFLCLVCDNPLEVEGVTE